MSLVKQLTELRINNLIVEYSGQEDGAYSFLLKTTKGRIVGIGWQAEDEFNEKEYLFWEKIRFIQNNHIISDLMSKEDWNSWEGKLILINSSAIWQVDFNVIYPQKSSEDNLDQFIKDIKSHFPELRSSNEINDSELNEMNFTIETQRTRTKLLTEENKELQNKIIELYSEIGKLEKGNKTKEAKLADSSVSMEQLIKERDYFMKGKVFEVAGNLSAEQKSWLIQLMNERSLKSLEINHDLFFPSLIVKIPITVIIEWDSHNDKVPAETYFYEVIDMNGSTHPTNIEEIMENPEAIVGSKLPYVLDDLRCCVSIDKNNLFLKV